jgi:hypothetical protein
MLTIKNECLKKILQNTFAFGLFDFTLVLKPAFTLYVEALFNPQIGNRTIELHMVATVVRIIHANSGSRSGLIEHKFLALNRFMDFAHCSAVESLNWPSDVCNLLMNFLDGPDRHKLYLHR